MAQHITVTLEHHLNRRYHTVNCGPGRRPSSVTYGRFNLRFCGPLHNGKRVRVPLDTRDLGEAVAARRRKEDELNAVLPVERRANTLSPRRSQPTLRRSRRRARKKTHQAYAVALRYFIEAIGDSSHSSEDYLNGTIRRRACWPSCEQSINDHLNKKQEQFIDGRIHD